MKYCLTITLKNKNLNYKKHTMCSRNFISCRDRETRNQRRRHKWLTEMSTSLSAFELSLSHYSRSWKISWSRKAPGWVEHFPPPPLEKLELKTFQWNVIIIIIIIIFVIIIFVVAVDDNSYYWFYVSSDHPFQVYYKVRQVWRLWQEVTGTVLLD